MPCEKTILADIPLTTSTPGWDEVIIFTLPDGTSVIRKWVDIFAATTPNDVHMKVVAAGTPGVDLINNDTEFIITNFIGKRGRLRRNGLTETTIAGGTVYSFDTATGKFTFTAATTDEIFIFEAY